MNPDSKLAINSRTGKKRYLTPKIYNNPIRMRTGGWQLIEEPVTPDSGESVMVNMPGMPLTISGSTSGTVSTEVKSQVPLSPVAQKLADHKPSPEPVLSQPELGLIPENEEEVKPKKSPAKPVKK